MLVEKTPNQKGGEMKKKELEIEVEKAAESLKVLTTFYQLETTIYYLKEQLNILEATKKDFINRMNSFKDDEAVEKGINIQ